MRARVISSARCLAWRLDRAWAWNRVQQISSARALRAPAPVGDGAARWTSRHVTWYSGVELRRSEGRDGCRTHARCTLDACRRCSLGALSERQPCAHSETCTTSPGIQAVVSLSAPWNSNGVVRGKRPFSSSGKQDLKSASEPSKGCGSSAALNTNEGQEDETSRSRLTSTVSSGRMEADGHKARMENHSILRTVAHKVAYIGAGITAGFLGSLVGLGGGIWLVPLLVFLGLPQQQAHGTSMVAVSGTSLMAAFIYSMGGMADPSAALVVASAALFTAYLGAKTTAGMDPNHLRRRFGWYLVFASALMPLRPFLSAKINNYTSAGNDEKDWDTSWEVSSIVENLESWTIVQWTGILTTGAVAGFVSGLLGVGGGTVVIPALGLIAGMPQQLAQGTALLGLCIPTLVGSATHFRKGNVKSDVFPFLVAGSFVGGYLGSQLALDIPEDLLRYCFSAALMVMGLYQALGRAR
ncbi:hypothetical protein FVE85_3200 [Porphyridium purpureum]|uniref:Membrane transporter protein n=1 Tax=Porphyridium purpureum TaxID=35688 RepID=A0A5J4YTX6_PORPP|nr:hypothetical protein FVE85_3200 [Porphyridium purpureum]|eukprot:POR1307..scf227_4